MAGSVEDYILETRGPEYLECWKRRFYRFENYDVNPFPPEKSTIGPLEEKVHHPYCNSNYIGFPFLFPPVWLAIAGFLALALLLWICPK